jgi:hypothetical protein
MTTSAEETELELARSGDRHEVAEREGRPTRFWRYVLGGAAVVFVAPAILMLIFYWVPALIALLPVFQLDRVPMKRERYRHVTAQGTRGWAHPR